MVRRNGLMNARSVKESGRGIDLNFHLKKERPGFACNAKTGWQKQKIIQNSII